MSDSKFNNLKSDLETVALENRLEMVHITGATEADAYKCKGSVEIETK